MTKFAAQILSDKTAASLLAMAMSNLAIIRNTNDAEAARTLADILVELAGRDKTAELSKGH